MGWMFVPPDEVLEQEIVLPLYYTGLEDAALIAESDAKPIRMKLDREYRIRIRARVPVRSNAWFVIR